MLKTGRNKVQEKYKHQDFPVMLYKGDEKRVAKDKSEAESLKKIGFGEAQKGRYPHPLGKDAEPAKASK